MRPTRRGTAVAPVPPQLNPPRLPDRVLRPWRMRPTRRGTAVAPVPPQDRPAEPVDRIRPPWRWRVARRGASSMPTPPQVNPLRLPDRVRTAWRMRPVRRGTAVAPIPPQALRAAIPGYFYPTLGGWATMCTYPNQPAVIIANIGGSGGPGTSVNSDYTTWITNAVTAGITVIGYVDTNYATRTIGTPSDTASSNTVYGDINGWKTLYPNIGGYFLDRVPTASGVVLTATQTTISYARSVIQGGPVFANCGAYPAVSGYIDAADVTVVFEGDYNVSGYPTTVPPSVPGYAAGYPAAKFMHLVYNVASVQAMQVAVGTAKTTNTGWLYCTDAGALLNNLASYWASPERFDLWTQFSSVDPAPATSQSGRRRISPPGSFLRSRLRVAFGAYSAPIPPPYPYLV